MKVIVSCSGKFHAFALAEQLQKHGVLHKLYTSYSSITNPLVKYLVSRRDRELIPAKRINTVLPIAFGLKLYNKPLFWNDLFDRWVAWQIKRSDATVFIGWSGMSLRSIREAKAKGMITILERGSSHISHQLNILKEEYAFQNQVFALDTKIENRECCEYELTDYISLPSRFTAKTFIDYSFNPNKIMVNNYGVSSHFKLDRIQKNKSFLILFLGKISVQKGVVYLIKSINDLVSNGYNVKGLFIGSLDKDFEAFINKINVSNIEFKGQVDHYKLPTLIPNSSVAVVPSIQDGFGMVVPQILACNVPVILSENTGAADIIVEGSNGFIVPIRDSIAIANKIMLLYDNPMLLNKMQEYIMSNPIDLSWDAYGNRYIRNIRKVIKQFG